MKLPRAILFDLDGTLSDSLPDIAWALNEARAAHALARVSIDSVRSWVGSGAAVLVTRSMGLRDETDPRVAPVLSTFLSIYEKHADDRSRLYPGALDLLHNLRARGVRLAVVTNKPREACLALLRGLRVLDAFDAVMTPEDAGVRKPDPRFMLAALERLGVEPKDALVVGDGVQDVEAAKGAGIRCVAVLSGYGDPGELVARGPDIEVDSIQDLAHQLGVRA